MMAADGIEHVLTVDAWRRVVSRFNTVVVLLAVAGILGYCSGHARGEASARSAVADSVRKVLADSSKAIEARIEARAPSLLATAQQALAARAMHADARAKVIVVSDTVLRVDSVEVRVPVAVTQTIQRADTVILRDSLVLIPLRAQVADLTQDRDTWKRRALMDEVQLRTSSKFHFGFKSGVVAGIVGTAVLVSLVR